MINKPTYVLPLSVILAYDDIGQTRAQEIYAGLEERYSLRKVQEVHNECYPDAAFTAAQFIVAADLPTLGIFICGTGIGMSIAANKIKGIRAALCLDTYSAGKARSSNNANVLCMGAKNTGIAIAHEIVDEFMLGQFDPKSPSGIKVSAIDYIDMVR